MPLQGTKTTKNLAASFKCQLYGSIHRLRWHVNIIVSGSKLYLFFIASSIIWNSNHHRKSTSREDFSVPRSMENCFGEVNSVKSSSPWNDNFLLTWALISEWNFYYHFIAIRFNVLRKYMALPDFSFLLRK